MSTRNRTSYLSKQQVRQIWNAASFSIQEFGRPLNTAFSMTASEPIKAPAGRFFHCLEQRLRYWNPSIAETLPWISVQSRSQLEGYTMVYALPIPSAIQERLIEWFSDHRKHYPELTSLSANWPTNGQRPIKQHLQLLALCCRATDPRIWVRDDGESRRLLDLVSPASRPADSFLPVEGRRVEIASCIGRHGQSAAAGDGMAMISAFDDGAFSDLRTGWEVREHEDRTAVRRERAIQEARLARNWPANKSALFDLKRAEEIQKLRKSDPKGRDRSWDPWWLSRTEITDNLNRNVRADDSVQKL
jgi:hypothetical protein